MFKVIEKKFFILLIVVLSMMVVPFLAQAGGMGGMSSMSSKHGSTAYTYYTDSSRLGSYYTSPYYSNYYNYNPLRTTSVLYPNTYGTPYNYGSLYSYGGLNPLTYGYGQQQVVTGKEYTQEQSYTQYVPGGEITTTLGETTETSVLNPYSNFLSPYTYNYNYGLGTGYLGNAYNYGIGTTYPYNYGYNYGLNYLY